MRPACRALGLLVVATGFVAAQAASCSLDLDESRLDTPREAGVTDVQRDAETDGAGGDSAMDDERPRVVCERDEDCRSSSPCLSSRCDTSRRRCVHSVCATNACMSAACDPVARACGAPKPHGLRASQFQVGAGVGCGATPARCIAAVHPFVFVGTGNAVVAFRAADLAQSPPPRVPVFGLTFLPTAIVAGDHRVFFFGAPAGAGGVSRLPLAYADVPTDPFAARIDVVTVLASYDRPPSAAVALFARAQGTALLVDMANAPANGYPTATVEPPFAEPLALSSHALPFTGGTQPVASSGTRLLMRSLSAGGHASFGLIEGAGSRAPTNTGDTPAEGIGPVSPPESFGANREGALFWSVSSLTGPPGAPSTTIRAVKGAFLVANETSPLDFASALDVETYTPPAAPAMGAAAAGPVAMIDPQTALVTSAVPGSPNVTNVSFARRHPVGLVASTDGAPRRFTIAAPPHALGASATQGLGYVLAAESSTNASVYVFDPACDP